MPRIVSGAVFSCYESQLGDQAKFHPANEVRIIEGAWGRGGADIGVSTCSPSW